MSFEIDIGWSSHGGPRPRNEDFAAVRRPDPGALSLGWIAALADGIASGGDGRIAAQTTVMTLVEDYFDAPPTWDTTVVLDRVLQAQNRWLVDHNRRRAWAEDAGTALTTLTALVLRGQSWTLAHVGDSRAWLLRDGELACLTTDHVLPQGSGQHTVTRAVGLDDHLQADYLQGSLRVGDLLLLSSDGVHGTLHERTIAQVCAQAQPAEALAQELVRLAHAAGSPDNASAVVLRVRGLDRGRFDDLLVDARGLPPAPRLAAGQQLDGYRIEAELADTGLHRLYRAREVASNAVVVIKALHESRCNDAEERAMLAHEAWLGRRLGERSGQTGGSAPDDGASFVRVREPPLRSAFYLVFEAHEGATLEQLLAQRAATDVTAIVRSAAQIVRALARLHRAGVVHRDIKPSNLHRGDDGRWRILDLGAAVSGREPALLRELAAGTPSYMNPEQWDDPPAPAGPASDLFAFGVTLYRWLTGRLPYGEIEPYQRARYRRDPVAPSRYAPQVPIWLDRVVQKAVARDPASRFESAEELLLALERGAARPLAPPLPTPQVQRLPAQAWRIALAFSLLLNALLLLMLAALA